MEWCDEDDDWTVMKEMMVEEEKDEDEDGTVMKTMMELPVKLARFPG